MRRGGRHQRRAQSADVCILLLFPASNGIQSSYNRNHIPLDDIEVYNYHSDSSRNFVRLNDRRDTQYVIRVVRMKMANKSHRLLYTVTDEGKASVYTQLSDDLNEVSVNVIFDDDRVLYDRLVHIIQNFKKK